MNTPTALALAATLLLALPLSAARKSTSERRAVLVIHGGAGTITRASLTPQLEQQYREALTAALIAGHAALKAGGSSIDAVEAAIRPLEDSPLFNAGKGAVFTHDGRNELDAAIMSGAGQRAGAVAGVTIIRNPITAARAVMDKSPHVIMVGKGAELFATEHGLSIVDPSYFWTERRWKQLQTELMKPNGGTARLDHAPNDEEKKFGTVGAVAVDRMGNLAAGTSTGGMTNKKYGRVGDAPVIGAGTWASNDSCAVSATGHGEFFIRYGVAHEIAARVRLKGQSVATAASSTIEELRKVGGEGGVIVLDRQGNFAMPFNSEGMYRGWIGEDGSPHVLIYAEAPGGGE